MTDDVNKNWQASLYILGLILGGSFSVFSESSVLASAMKNIYSFWLIWLGVVLLISKLLLRQGAGNSNNVNWLLFGGIILLVLTSWIIMYLSKFAFPDPSQYLLPKFERKYDEFDVLWAVFLGGTLNAVSVSWFAAKQSLRWPIVLMSGLSWIAFTLLCVFRFIGMAL